MQYFLFIVAALALNTSAAPTSSLSHSNLVQPLRGAPTKSSERFIVKLKPTANQKSFDRDLKRTINADTSAAPGENEIVHSYAAKTFKGYAGTFSSTVLRQLRQNISVAYIERDSVGFIEGSQEKPPSWGLARVSSRKSTSGAPETPYVFPDTAGEGVTAYVIDTGIDASHPEFEGTRAKLGVNLVKDDPDEDGHGHGTHVSGTIVGKTFGIAKKAHVVGVKVCNAFGSCTVSDVVAGISWVMKNGTPFKSVVNISLGLQASQAIDDAVNAAVEAGIAIIVSGGNANTDSCLNSPRRAKFAFAVGAMDQKDKKASFSNYGKCLKIFAPGVDIVSSLPGNKSEAWSGTSMASPHVAGVATLYLGEKPYTSIHHLHADLVARASPKMVKDVPADTTDLLVYSFLKGGEDIIPPVVTPPVVTPPVVTPPGNSEPVQPQPITPTAN